MPLYEYTCKTCGHRFEVLQRIGEGADGLTCPACDASEVAKEHSTFASGSSTGSGFTAPAAGCGSGGFT